MSWHNRILGYGPNLTGYNHGTAEPEQTFTPSGEIKLGNDGSVSYKRNILTKPGGNYASAPHAANTTVGKYLENWG